MSTSRSATERARVCFVRACELDVAVRKPGNVSIASAGHGMDAQLFIASAQAAADPLFRSGARVGERIEAAVDASWRVAGCNTNLGIVLLCAPIARAAECADPAAAPGALQAAVEKVLADLDLDDAKAAFRAIARAQPGGLGAAPREDVHAAPSVDLRSAMALAAERDSIARQYRDGFAELFGSAAELPGPGFALSEHVIERGPGAATVSAVQRLYLDLLSRHADSHIVRKHGDAVAHIVMSAAQPWRARAEAGDALDADPAFAAWDETLKADRINPGTTADLTVATLLIAGLTGAG